MQLVTRGGDYREVVPRVDRQLLREFSLVSWSLDRTPGAIQGRPRSECSETYRFPVSGA